uniref:peptidylprolyl isomerase n=1 Tax=Minutocellus polymorphus TaxID=265543 RepID=A0A7S0FHE4_9STRA
MEHGDGMKPPTPRRITDYATMDYTSFLLIVSFIIHFAHDVLAFAEQMPLLRHTTQRDRILTNLSDLSSKRYLLTPTTPTRCRQPLWALRDSNPSGTGLFVENTEVGSGPGASPGNIVTVKYTGRLQSNGKQFDAGTISFKLGEGEVIPGWEEGLENMQVGGKRKLTILPELAYGRNGAGGGIIPPNATLLFDVELLGISNGPLAELVAATGIGSNPRTALLLVFAGLVTFLVGNLTFPEDM